MLHQIGIGALGPVFRTYEPTRDRLVAVKVFRLDIVPEQAQALAAALGKAAGASLFHPSIVEPIAAGVEGTLAYRAEEYVAAESLDVAMRHYAPAPIERVLPFITQLAGAIDFARAAGVGHGGLHPRDIFVTPDDARATGFGVIEALEEAGIRAPVRRPYTAPERIDGKPWSTPADVFSLAAITFELLTARRPAGTGAVIGALPEGESSAALHAVLARAMHDDPSQRYAGALPFAAALESAARGRAEAPQPAPAVAVPSAPAVAPREIPKEPVPTSGEFTSERKPEPSAERPMPVVVPIAPKAPPEPAGHPLAAREPREPARAVEPPNPEPVEPEPLASEPLASEPLASEPLASEPLASEPQAAEPLASEPLEPEPVEPEEPVEPTEPTPRSVREPLLFDAVHTDARDEHFADDFRDTSPWHPGAATERIEPPEPLEPPAPEPAAPREPREPFEPLAYDSADSSRPAVLPTAIGIVLGLLAGFAGGYFVGSRDRLTPETTTASAPPTAGAPAPSGANAPAASAAGDQAGQYSDHKVSPPQPPGPTVAAPTEPKSTEPPPVVQETPTARGAESRGTPAAAAPPARERAKPSGTIVLKSSPSRAGVMVNGTWRGRTPLTLEHLAFGRYVVRIVQPGYRAAQEEFTLGTHDTEHNFTARLEPSGSAAKREPAAPKSEGATSRGFVGTLFVDSNPRGATVLLDGRRIGTTPLSLGEVPIGSHAVRVELAGKRTWTSSASVQAGQTTRVTMSLEDKQ